MVYFDHATEEFIVDDYSAGGLYLWNNQFGDQYTSGRDPAAMPWKDMDVEVIIESTGAFNSFEGGSKHLDAGAKKVVLTAPGTNCPTYVVGVNEGDYDPENDVVVSNASGTTNGMASVCKAFDESFGVEYGLMATTHSYTGDQMILSGRHRDPCRARTGACNIEGPVATLRWGLGHSCRIEGSQSKDDRHFFWVS